MNHQPVPEHFPKLDLQKSQRLFEKLDSGIFDALGETIDAENLEGWVTAVCQAMKTANVDRTAVESSLMGYSHMVLDAATLACLRWRLAVHWRELAAGRPVHPWSGHLPAGWLPLEFKELIGHEGLLLYRLEVLTGPAASAQVYKQTAPNHHSLATLTYKILGRTHSGNARELVGCRIWAEPVKRDQILSFYRYQVNEQLESYNSRLAAERRKQCHYGYTHLCVQCPVGRDRCKRAVNPFTPPNIGRLLREDVPDDSDESASQRMSSASPQRTDAVDEPGPGRSQHLSGTDAANDTGVQPPQHTADADVSSVERNG
jgi:hypothetical protein